MILVFLLTKLKALVLEFYIQNSFTLLNGFNRPIWFGILVLLIEHFSYFSLIFTRSFIEEQTTLDSTISNTKWISLHMIPDGYIQSLAIISLSLNTLIIILFQFFFVIFCLRKYHQQTSIFLSIFFLNYNSLLTLPSLVISLRNITNVFNLLNMISTLFLMVICSFYTNNVNSYFSSDFLAKRGNIWDNLRFPVISLGIIIFETFNVSKYSILILLIAIANILSILSNNIFYQRRTTELYLCLNISLILITIEALLIEQSSSPHSFVVISLCLVSLSYGAAVNITKSTHFFILNAAERMTMNYSYKHNKITINKDNDNMQFNLFFQQDSTSIVDYFARYLLQKYKDSKQNKLLGRLFKNNLIFFSTDNSKVSNKDNKNIQKLPQQDIPFDKQSEVKDKSVFHKNELNKDIQNNRTEIACFLAEDEEIAKVSMKQQINRLFKMTLNSQEKSRMLSTSYKKSFMEYLFYLLEIEENYPKLAIKIFEFEQKQLNLSELSVVQYLKSQLEAKMNKDIAKGISEDLAQTFKFEENLVIATASLKECIIQKGKFLRELSKDIINLSDIEKTGSKLLELINQLAHKLIDIRSNNTHSEQLECIHELFVETLWIDPTDKQLTMLKIKRKELEMLMNKKKLYQQSKNYSKSHKILNFQSLILNTCSVMVSLEIGKQGHIIKVTKNIEAILGYSVKDLESRNCEMLMPYSIGRVHNQLISAGINSGMGRTLKKNKLLLAKNKDQFGMHFDLKLQVHTLINGQIGLIGQLKFMEKEGKYQNQQFILADVQNGQCNIELISEALFVNILGHYFTNPGEIEGIKLHQILPCLSGIADYLKNQTDQITLKYPSLLYLPQKNKRIDRRKRRLHDQSQDFTANALKKYYEEHSNDIFQVELKIKHFFRSGMYEMILIKVKSAERIKTKHKYIEILSDSYLNQLWKMKVIKTNELSKVFEILTQEEDIYAQSSGASRTVHQNNQSTQSWKVTNSKETDDRSFQQNVLREKQNSYSTSMTYFAEENDKRDRSQQFKLKFAAPELTQSSDAKFLKAHKVNSSDFLQQESSAKRLSGIQVDFSQNNMQINNTEKQDTMGQHPLQRIDSQNAEELLQNIDELQQIQRQPKSIDNDLCSESKLGFTNNLAEEITPQNEQLQTSKECEDDKNNNNILSPRYSSVHDLKNNQPLHNKPLDFKHKGFSRSYSTYLKEIKDNNQDNDDKSSNQTVDKSSGFQAMSKRIRSQQAQRTNNKKSAYSQEQSTISKQTRYVVNRKISEQQNSNILRVLFGYILCSFIGMLLIVTISFALLQSNIAAEQLSSDFSWWQVIQTNHIAAMIRLNEVHSIIEMNAFQFSSDPKVIALDNSISSKVLGSFNDYLAAMKQLSKHDPSDLEFVSFMHNLKVENQIISLTTMTLNSITMSIYDTLFFFSLDSFQLSLDSFIFKKQTLLEISSNQIPIQAALVVLGQQQDNSLNQLINDIKASVQQSLILVSVISGVIALVMIQFNAFFIGKKEFILNLFASLEPACIVSMHQQLVLSLEILESNSEFKEDQSGFNQLPVKINQIQNNRGMKKTLMNVSFKGNISAINQGLGLINLKRKKNVPTSRLQRYNFKLILYVIFVTCIINIQPIVNTILTSDQLNQSDAQQELVKGLYSVESTFQILEYATLLHAQLTKDPQSQLVPAATLPGTFPTSLAQIKELMVSTISQLFSLSNNSRYANNSIMIFLTLIFSSDLCQGLMLFPEYISTSYDYEECVKLYGGVFTKGYATVVQTFSEIFQTYYEITQLTDSTLQLQQLDQFFELNDPLVFERLLNMLSIATEAVVTAISEENQSYFNTIKITQYLLFSWETLLLIIIFPTLIFPFFTFIKQQILTSIRMISVLQLQTILMNKYIISFLATK